jgi:hypothetical protein
MLNAFVSIGSKFPSPPLALVSNAIIASYPFPLPVWQINLYQLEELAEEEEGWSQFQPQQKNQCCGAVTIFSAPAPRCRKSELLIQLLHEYMSKYQRVLNDL